MSQQAITKKRKAIQDGLFKAELNNFLMKVYFDFSRHYSSFLRNSPKMDILVLRCVVPLLVLKSSLWRHVPKVFLESVASEFVNWLLWFRNVLDMLLDKLRFILLWTWFKLKAYFQLYAEKVSSRGLCAVAQCESLRYKLVGGLAVRRACYGFFYFLNPLFFIWADLKI